MLSSQYVNMEGQSWVMERGLLVARLRLDFFPPLSLSLCEGLSLCLPCLSLCLTLNILSPSFITPCSIPHLHPLYLCIPPPIPSYLRLPQPIRFSPFTYKRQSIYIISVSRSPTSFQHTSTRHEANSFHPSIPMSLLTLLHSM